MLQKRIQKWLAALLGAIVTVSLLAGTGVGLTTARADDAAVPYAVSITGGEVTSLENGKTYVFLSYPGGAQAISAIVKPVWESSGSYNYLKPVPVTVDTDAKSLTFDSQEDAEYCLFTAEANPSVKGQFRLKNGNAWIKKYYSMMETTSDADEAVYVTYSKSRGLQDAAGGSYPYITCSSNVYKGWTQVTSPIKVYEAVIQAEEYTVNFETGGGSAIAPVAVKAGQTLAKPEDPVKEEYLFDGWYTDQTLTTPWSFDMTVTSALTLYAKWKSATNESADVTVKRASSFVDGKNYIIVNSDRTLAMATGRGNESFDNSREGKTVTFSADGKTLSFSSLEDKHAAIWTAAVTETNEEQSMAALKIGESCLGTYQASSHYPAEENDNTAFYINGDYLRAKDTGYAITYDRTTWKGFRPNNNADGKAYVYQVVTDEDAQHEHLLIKTEAVAATCDKVGQEAYWRCAECGDLFADEKGETLLTQPVKIPALGHAYGAWARLDEEKHQRVCSHDSSHTESGLHTWDAGVVTKEATAEAEGEMTYTCTACGATKTAVIAVTVGTCPVSGSAGYLIEAKPATTLENGKQYLVLSRDNTKAMTSENIRTEYGGYRLKAVDVSYQQADGRLVFPTPEAGALSLWTCEGSSLTQAAGTLYDSWAYVWCGDESYYDDGGNLFVYEYQEETGYGLLHLINSNYRIGYDSSYGAFCANTDLGCLVYEVTGILGLSAGSSHNLVKTDAASPTCTEAGNIAYYRCSKCKHYFLDEAAAQEISYEDTVLEALGHDTVLTAAVAPACEEDGNSAYYTCGRCGEYFADAAASISIAADSWILPATGHTWDEGTVTTAPGCEEDGVRTYTCLADPIHQKTETIPATDHDFFLKASYEATCEEDGYELWECRNCGQSEIRNRSKATGHEYAEAGWNWAADYSSAELELVCSLHAEPVTAVLQAEITKKITDPTAETEGKVLYTAAVTADNGKTYTDTRTRTLDPLENVFVLTNWNWVGTDADGYTQAEATFENQATGEVVTKEAVLTRTETAATCETAGEICYHAAVTMDGIERTAEQKILLPATGHDWQEGSVVKEATCTEDGETAYICKNDPSHTKSVITEASGHALTRHAAKAATASAAGNREYYQCGICHKYFADPAATQELSKEETILAKLTVKKITPVVKLSKTVYTYNGKAKKPKVTVKDGNKTLSADQYTVTYAKGRKNVGTYQVRVTLKGSYSGSKTVTFKINPKKISVKTTAGKKGFTAKWTKQTKQTDGYQIQYSTAKNFKSGKTVTIKKAKTASKKITRLKAKKTYYVRIRTYKKVGGKTYYSAWSAVKKVKTK